MPTKTRLLRLFSLRDGDGSGHGNGDGNATFVMVEETSKRERYWHCRCYSDYCPNSPFYPWRCCQARVWL